jgi:hypothetical protein
VLSDKVERLVHELSEERRERTADYSRADEKIMALEVDVVHTGLESLKQRLDEVARTVPEQVCRASISAMESHLQNLANSVREELRLQEERVLSSSLNALEARLHPASHVSVGVTDDTDVVSVGAFSGAAAAPSRDGLQMNVNTSACDDSCGTPLGERMTNVEMELGRHKESLGCRMNELAGMLREELRRQDTLESRIQELAGAFHDELRRQEDVIIPNSIAALEGRLERFAERILEELQRQESVVLCSGLAKLEAQIGELAGGLRDTNEAQEAAQATQQAAAERFQQLVAELASQEAETSAVRVLLSDSVKSWAEKEVEIWHALDTHTHDIAVDQKAPAPVPSAPSAPNGFQWVEGSGATLHSSSSAAFSSNSHMPLSSHCASTSTRSGSVGPSRCGTPQLSAGKNSLPVQSTITAVAQPFKPPPPMQANPMHSPQMAQSPSKAAQTPRKPLAHAACPVQSGMIPARFHRVRGSSCGATGRSPSVARGSSPLRMETGAMLTPSVPFAGQVTTGPSACGGFSARR